MIWNLKKIWIQSLLFYCYIAYKWGCNLTLKTVEKTSFVKMDLGAWGSVFAYIV